MSNLATIQPQTLAVPTNPFEPQSLPQAMTLAETISKSGLVPTALRGKPADVLIILMTARELGIGPMQGMSDINVIQGKPVYSADLMVAQCKRRRDRCEYFILVESTDDHATYETKAVGSPKAERYTFSVEDAKALGLLGKDNWNKQRKTMLRRRAAAACAREVYQDLVRGYDPEEMEEVARPTPQPTSVTVTDVTPSKARENVQAAAEQLGGEVVEAQSSAVPPRVALWTRLVEREGSAKARRSWAEAADKALGKDRSPAEWTTEQCAQVEAVLFPVKAEDAPEPDKRDV